MAFSDAFNNTRNSVINAKQQDEDLRIRRGALNEQKRQRDQDLQMAGYDPNTMNVMPGSKADADRLQNLQTTQLLNAVQGKLAAQETDNAVLDYSKTGDAGYLQKALDRNPMLKQAWAARGVQQVANVDWQNDAQILAQAGFNGAEYDTPEKQAILRKNIYKVYDGQNWTIGLLNKAVAETGVLDRVGNERGQPLMDNYQEFRSFLAGPKSSAWTAEGHKYEREITQASEATGVPANLLAAMMKQESGGNPTAVSPKGAQGLMQLMPGTAQELGVTDPNDPMQSIMGGAKYMAQQLEKYNGNTKLALAAYNAGPGAVDKHGGIPPYSETQDYVSKIMQNYSAGESYYDTGTQVAGGDWSSATGDQNKRLDERISTIQKFNRDQALAAAGSDISLESGKVEAAKMDAQARTIAATAKLQEASTGSTTKQKDLRAAEDHTDSMIANFGGEDGFFATDFSKPENFNKAWKDVVKINKLEGTELTNADKDNISGFKELIALADPASELSAAQTGILDKAMSDAKKYITETSTGVERTAALAAFRNTLRHALYGSTLTDGEIAAFNEAYGTNKQKLGPVLAQFNTALTQLEAKMEAVSKLNNPYTMHVMIGADQKKLSNIRTALKQRIDYINGMINEDGSANKDKPLAPKSQPVDTRPPLAEIFGG